MFSLVIVVQEENVGEIDRAARDVDRMECVDKRLVDVFDVIVLWRVDDGGERRMGLREETFCFLWGSHVSDSKGVALTERATMRERSGDRGYQAVVSAAEELWRYLN